jgi:hypothetical protein
MQRKNYGRNSGVIIDVCLEHGIWFDRRELPLVLRFVEQGGLDRAEAAAAREAADRDRQERIDGVSRRSVPGRPLTRMGANLQVNEAVLSALADALFGR